MPLRPEPVQLEVLMRLAALDARCDWSVRRGTHRGMRVYWVRVWERHGNEPDGTCDQPRPGASFYQWTLADSLKAIVICGEERGWHRPAGRLKR